MLPICVRSFHAIDTQYFARAFVRDTHNSAATSVLQVLKANYFASCCCGSSCGKAKDFHVRHDFTPYSVLMGMESSLFSRARPMCMRVVTFLVDYTKLYHLALAWLDSQYLHRIAVEYNKKDDSQQMCYQIKKINVVANTDSTALFMRVLSALNARESM